MEDYFFKTIEIIARIILFFSGLVHLIALLWFWPFHGLRDFALLLPIIFCSFAISFMPLHLMHPSQSEKRIYLTVCLVGAILIGVEYIFKGHQDIILIYISTFIASFLLMMLIKYRVFPGKHYDGSELT
jgi:hypothetical protein